MQVHLLKGGVGSNMTLLLGLFCVLIGTFLTKLLLGLFNVLIDTVLTKET